MQHFANVVPFEVFSQLDRGELRRETYASKRARFRDLHLKYAWAAHARGELVLGGALADPIDGAVILFRADTREVAERFAECDPYVVNGVVTRWHVREWTTVVGLESATPLHPE